jgi:hypothetical protein
MSLHARAADAAGRADATECHDGDDEISGPADGLTGRTVLCKAVSTTATERRRHCRAERSMLMMFDD